MPNKQFFLSFENFEKGLIVLYALGLPAAVEDDDPMVKRGAFSATASRFLLRPLVTSSCVELGVLA